MASDRSVLSTNKILASVKRRILAPTSNDTFKDDDLIEFLNEEMNIGLVPTILQMKDEYLVYKELVPIEASKYNYPIPTRAIGNKLREVAMSTDGIDEVNLTRIQIDSKTAGHIGRGSSNQFFVQGNNICLFPNTGAAGYLVFYYYMRPNFLVKDNAVAIISNIDRTTGTITVENLPSTYTTSQKYDFVNYQAPNNILTIENSILGINTLTKTITISPSLIPVELKVGDHIPLAGETCLPNVPSELQSILAQRVGIRVLEALGDTNGVTMAKDKLNEMEGKLGLLLDNRVEGSVAIMVNKSAQNMLAGRFRRGFM